SRKGPRSRTHDGKVRSTRTKARARVGNGPNSLVELKRLQPIFDTLVENIVRLCEAERAFLWPRKCGWRSPAWSGRSSQCVTSTHLIRNALSSRSSWKPYSVTL